MVKESTVVFAGTDEQKKQLDEVIAKYKDVCGALIPVLHEAQSIYGYLPEEVQLMIAEGLGVTPAEVYGVVSFYHHFTVDPKGKYVVSVCMGTACYVKGAGNIVEKCRDILNIEVGGCSSDGKFSLDATRCIGACGLAPVMTVNDDVYGRLNLDDVEGILKKYIGEVNDGGAE